MLRSARPVPGATLTERKPCPPPPPGTAAWVIWLRRVRAKLGRLGHNIQQNSAVARL